jgi:hypothetical protein
MVHNLKFTKAKWAGQYRIWKKVILTIMRYKRPVALREFNALLNKRYKKIEEDLNYMVECGVLKRYPDKTYEVNWENIKDSIVITNDEAEIKEYMEELEYIKYVQMYGPKIIAELYEQGIEDEDELKYEVDKRIKKKMNRPKKKKKKVTKRKKHYHTQQDLWDDGTVGELMRGEITFEEYERRTNKAFEN